MLQIYCSCITMKTVKKMKMMKNLLLGIYTAGSKSMRTSLICAQFSSESGNNLKV